MILAALRRDLIRYLETPMRQGVEFASVVIPGEPIAALWKFAKSGFRNRKLMFNTERPELDMSAAMINSFDRWHLCRLLDEILRAMTTWKRGCPMEVATWGNYGQTVLSPEYSEEGEESHFFPPQAYFPDIQDGLALNVDTEAYPDLALEITSLTKKPIKLFEAFLSSIPRVRSQLHFSGISRKHSARYSMEPYAALTALWIDEMAAGSFPRDVINLFGGSLEYFYQREWRTSIVLSSIAAEMILAEMYEESQRRVAGDWPLGTLLDKVVKAGKLSNSARNDCAQLVRMRNSAVHRGTTPLTDKEATIALHGTVMLALSHYPVLAN